MKGRRRSTTFTFEVDVVHDQHPEDLAAVIGARLTEVFRDEGATVWGWSATWRNTLGARRKAAD